MKSTLPITACCKRFLERWDMIRGRSDIAALCDFLAFPDPVLQPHMMIVDVVDEAMLRVRLFATRLTELIGADITGDNLMRYESDERMSRHLSELSQAMVNQRCGLLVTKSAVTTSGSNIVFEILWLPMEPFAGGAPVIASANDVIGGVAAHDKVLNVVDYVSARWVDLGHGVPAGAPVH